MKRRSEIPPPDLAGPRIWPRSGTGGQRGKGADGLIVITMCRDFSARNGAWKRFGSVAVMLVPSANLSPNAKKIRARSLKPLQIVKSDSRAYARGEV